MTPAETRALALRLLHADTAKDVVQTLQDAGLWDDARMWRLYGDTETNFSTMNNQQSRPEAALVEKIVNCVDARLMNECLMRGIDPTTDRAPQSIREAVARFFGSGNAQSADAELHEWDVTKQREQARYITVAVTGATARAGNACITIADNGEGQVPSRVTDTFLSIDRGNKLRIPFVQGKFNMGGTGALKFCGEHSLQLLITRRNPALLTVQERATNASNWSFAVVRRERPTEGAGHVRNSVYRYLAPVGATDRPEHGGLLSFSANALPFMPEQNEAYKRDLSFGSVIKLYEYDMRDFRSHALMNDGLLFKLETLLPGIALPVRVHECRSYRGVKERSFENSLVGLIARLKQDRGKNLEDGYPTSLTISVQGEQMTAQIYAFKGNTAETYSNRDGVIFAINGQTHGTLPRTFFERKNVKMQRLAKSLVVIVDCSSLSVGAREDLFMNSRDRLSNGQLRKAVEGQLEDAIGHHHGLRELQERRRSLEVQERLEESKPLEDVLGTILKRSPTLSRLFLFGQRLNKALLAQLGTSGAGQGGGTGDGNSAFAGNKHPTFFYFQKKKPGEELHRSAEIGRRCRIKFETDVVNDYFSRNDTPGRYHLEVLEGSLEGRAIDHSLTLHEGVANWSMSLPDDSITAGDKVVVQCTVEDATTVEPFVSIAHLTLQPQSRTGSGGGGTRNERSGHANGSRGGENSDGRSDKGARQGDMPSGIQLPDIRKVRRGDANWTEKSFDDFTACVVVEDPIPGDDERTKWTFYVNVDNASLQNEIKGGREDAAPREAVFVFANVLIALALINDLTGKARSGDDSTDEEDISVADRVKRTTRAIAPFLLPMIENLGGLSEEDISTVAQIGDES